MGKNYETELPAGYREVFTVDAEKDKTFIIWMNVAAIVIAAVIILAGWLIIRPQGLIENYSLLRNLLLLAALFAYIVLHELVHGAAYKMLTGRKLTFGITMTVAFCGVPDIYVYRKTALISLMAPFTVFTVVFLAMAFLLPDAWDRFYAVILLGVHAGGCAGDLYDTFLYLTKFRDPSTLMNDTGPKQTFYQAE